jgi:hypothetical protein
VIDGRRTAASLAIALAAILALASATAAQATAEARAETVPADASAAQVAEECRVLFAGADAAADHGRMAEAADLYARSLALCPRAPTAYTLAVVLAGAGRFVDAERMLSRLLDGELGEVSDALRTVSEDARRAARTRIAVVDVALDAPAATTLRFDGELTAPHADGALRVRTDPGPHVLLAQSPDGRSVERALELEPGASVRVSLAIAPLEIDAPSHDAWSEPWLHVLLGVALAAGGAALAVGLVVADQPPSIDDPVWAHAEALARF